MIPGEMISCFFIRDFQVHFSAGMFEKDMLFFE